MYFSSHKADANVREQLTKASDSGSDYSMDEEDSSEESEEYFSTTEDGSLVLQQKLAKHESISFKTSQYWDGYGWKDSNGVYLARKLQVREFRVLCWKANERRDLSAAIRRLQPDFIFVQDGTRDFMDSITARACVHSYYSSAKGDYPTLIFSHVKFHESAMKFKQNLQLVSVVVKDNPQLYFSSFQITKENYAKRLSHFHSLISELPRMITCGTVHAKYAEEVAKMVKDQDGLELVGGLGVDRINNLSTTGSAELVDEKLRVLQCYHTPTLECVSSENLTAGSVGHTASVRSGVSCDGLFVVFRLKN
eukprot:TRINITY_DN7267_c0_g1_i6.p1 TRINITY_DN7267_c0_g1~~TRINITY_DN7267_c0_g1_i6.p1  ORF type:complete len:308 (-),score=63.12 TRINITY_DN7267_c0_g1_i6:61-984(-)